MQTTPTIAPTPARAATIGFFDGVHRGHQYLARQLCQLARERDLVPAAVTFPPLRRCLLSSLGEKVALLQRAGIGHVEVLPFDDALRSLTARQFMEQVLLRRLGARLLLIGYDNRFGRGRAEGFDDYVRHGRELGIEVVRALPLLEEGVGISSSLVRSLLDEGDVARAAHCLGRPYALSGRVVAGRQIGRRLGFPTANVQPLEPLQLVPATGVYAVRVALADGSARWQGMMNIGTRPTFDGHGQTLEAHLFDFRGNLYDRTLVVSFVARLRGEQPFPSAEALAAQLRADAGRARELLQTIIP